MKKIISAIFLIVLFFSCKNKDIAVAYQYGTTTVYPITDTTVIRNYLRGAGCQMKPLMFIGEDTTVCDAQALSLWEDSFAKITLDAIDSLYLSDTTTFTYSCCRFLDPSKPNSAIIYIGRFDYAKIIPDSER
jgi:hypothetical protein